MPEEQAKQELVHVAGHQITPKEFSLFEDLTLNNLPALDASRKYGLTLEQVRRAKRTEWFIALEQEYLNEQQSKLHRRLSEDVDLMHTAVREILQGARSEDRTTNSQVKIIELFAKMGEKPLIASGGAGSQVNVQINNSTQNIAASVDLDKLRNASEDEVAAILATGNVPEEFRTVGGE